MNSNRDPSDLDLTSAAVAEWLTTDPHDGDANNHLLMVLVEQGVLTPDEASEAHIEECEDEPRADIFIQGGDLCVSVEEDGTVFTTDCR